jgi:predicted RNA-binding protein Jag
MPWITKEGRTVEEAQQAAVAESGLGESDLDIEVVNEGAKGLFGLGGEPAVVRVRPKDEATDFRHAFQDDITPSPEPGVTPARTITPPADDDARDDTDDDDTLYGDEASRGVDVRDEEIDEGLGGEEKRPLSERQEEAAQLGAEIVRGILERMNIEGEINTRVAGGTVYIEVFGDEMGILIGRSGTTLEALQELVRAGIQRRLKTRQAVVVDVEAYWERRRKPRGRDADERGGERRGGGRGGDRRRGGRGGGRGGEKRDGGGREREVDGNR